MGCYHQFLPAAVCISSIPHPSSFSTVSAAFVGCRSTTESILTIQDETNMSLIYIYSASTSCSDQIRALCMLLYGCQDTDYCRLLRLQHRTDVDLSGLSKNRLYRAVGDFLKTQLASSPTTRSNGADDTTGACVDDPTCAQSLCR